MTNKNLLIETIPERIKKVQEDFEGQLKDKRSGAINPDILWDKYNESQLIIDYLYGIIGDIDKRIFNFKNDK
jgi:hypothetical protein